MLKKIASNTLAQLVAKFLGAGLTLITTTIIIRVSGVEVYGEVIKALVLVAIGFTLSDFGLNAIAVRAFSQQKSPTNQFQTLLHTRLAISLLVALGTIIFVQFLPGGYPSATKEVFWVGSLAIIFQGVYTSCNALFQYKENYWHSTLATILGTGLGATLTVYYTLTNPTIFNFLFANSAGYLLMAFSALYLAKAPLPAWPRSRTSSLTLLRSASPLGLALILSVIASKVDTIILGVFRSSAEVGEYGLAYRFFDVLLVLPVFLMNATYPRLVKISADASRALVTRLLYLMGGAGVIIATLTYLFAPLLSLIRPEMYLAISSLRLLSFALPIFFLTAPLMWYLISQGEAGRNLKVYAFSALINIVLNLALIPRYGVLAAATTTLITELCILAFLLYYFSKLRHPNIKE